MPLTSLFGGDLNIEFRLENTLLVTFKAWTVSNGTGCTGLSVEAERIRSPVGKTEVVTAF